LSPGRTNDVAYYDTLTTDELWVFFRKQDELEIIGLLTEANSLKVLQQGTDNAVVLKIILYH